MLFDAHTHSFAALGGVARRGIYDNMRTAVDKVHKGKGRTVNARFAVMCTHYLYDLDFCNVASGWEKGRVQKNVQDIRRIDSGNSGEEHWQVTPEGEAELLAYARYLKRQGFDCPPTN